jgi:hypothetical protein
MTQRFSWVREGLSGSPRRVTWENPEAEHQIRVTVSGNPAKIAISCTCLGRPNEPHEPLARGECFPDGQAMAIWRRHMDEVAAEHTA